MEKTEEETGFINLAAVRVGNYVLREKVKQTIGLDVRSLALPKQNQRMEARTIARTKKSGMIVRLPD